jgi:hypothetical protein
MQTWKRKSPPGRRHSNSCRLASDRLRPQLLQVQQPPLLTRHPLGSWNMQHIQCRKQFSTMKKMLHVHPRCGLVRDQPAEGEDREERMPKRQMGSCGIRGSLSLLHHWYEMLFPRKIYADKDAMSTNDAEQSKRASWFTTIKLLTDVIELLPETPVILDQWNLRP